MSNQKSKESFFASVMKRILVSLSCVTVVASTSLPAAFADESTVTGASEVSTAPSWSDVNVGEAKTKSQVQDKKSASSESKETKSEPVVASESKETKSEAAATTESKETKSEAAAATESKETKSEPVATSESKELKSEAAATTESKESKSEPVAATESKETKSEAAATAESTDAKSEPVAASDGSETKATEAVTATESKETKPEVSEPVFSADLKLPKTGASEAEQLASVPILGAVSTNEPIVVDNDEAVETEATIKYEDLPTDEGKTRVKTGARFPVVISSQITTKTAKKGDPVEARLKYDLKIGDRLIAKKGAVVNGHINYSLPARSTMHSLISPTRWYRNSGCVGISFDEIINDKGEHLPLVAVPARAARIVKNKGEGRELGINHEGQVTGPWSQQLRYKAIRIGLNAALAPAGAFSFGAMPIALGVIGAANPSFAFMKPVGLNVRHRRIKGFFWGALSGVPGSWLIEDTVVKGQEAVIKPGDEFLAEFQQEFTGEPASEATMMPNAKSKVHGEVMPNEKKKGKK